MNKTQLLTTALSLGIAGTSMFGITQYTGASEDIDTANSTVVPTDEIVLVENENNFEPNIVRYIDNDGNMVELQGYFEELFPDADTSKSGFVDGDGKWRTLEEHEGLFSGLEGEPPFVFVDRVEKDGTIEYIAENGEIKKVDLHWTENQ